jgi:hypothetical protein
VGSDGVVDLAEPLDLHREGVAVVDRAAIEVMLLLMSSELGQLSSAVGLVVRGDEETEDALVWIDVDELKEATHSDDKAPAVLCCLA